MRDVFSNCTSWRKKDAAWSRMGYFVLNKVKLLLLFFFSAWKFRARILSPTHNQTEQNNVWLDKWVGSIEQNMFDNSILEICNVIANTVRRYSGRNSVTKRISTTTCAKLSELANSIINNADTNFSEYEKAIIGNETEIKNLLHFFIRATWSLDMAWFCTVKRVGPILSVEVCWTVGRHFNRLVCQFCPYRYVIMGRSYTGVLIELILTVRLSLCNKRAFRKTISPFLY